MTQTLTSIPSAWLFKLTAPSVSLLGRQLNIQEWRLQMQITFENVISQCVYSIYYQTHNLPLFLYVQYSFGSIIELKLLRSWIPGSNDISKKIFILSTHHKLPVVVSDVDKRNNTIERIKIHLESNSTISSKYEFKSVMQHVIIRVFQLKNYVNDYDFISPVQDKNILTCPSACRAIWSLSPKRITPAV